MSPVPDDPYPGWDVPDLLIEAIRIIRWEAAHANRNAQVSMDNPFEGEVDSVRTAAYWDGYTSAIEAVLRPLLPTGEAWQVGEPCGPPDHAHKMLLAAKARCSGEAQGLRIDIAASLLCT